MSLDLCLIKCQNQLVFFFFLIIPLVLSCLDQLRFIECYKQIIVHCADYLFFYWVSVFKGSFFYLCQSSAWLVRKCWARDFLFHHSIEPKSVIGLVTSINLLLFFFFSPVKWNAKCSISFFFYFRQFKATKRCKRYIHWFAMYIVDSSFFYQNNFLFGFFSMPLCNKVSLAVPVWTCHWYPS